MARKISSLLALVIGLALLFGCAPAPGSSTVSSPSQTGLAASAGSVTAQNTKKPASAVQSTPSSEVSSKPQEGNWELTSKGSASCKTAYQGVNLNIVQDIDLVAEKTGGTDPTGEYSGTITIKCVTKSDVPQAAAYGDNTTTIGPTKVTIVVEKFDNDKYAAAGEEKGQPPILVLPPPAMQKYMAVGSWPLGGTYQGYAVAPGVAIAPTGSVGGDTIYKMLFGDGNGQNILAIRGPGSVMQFLYDASITKK